jgi:P27 family predicted phage terminase small subunit
MARPGPSPKPLELKALEGRSHRPLNLDQVFRPEVGAPDIPRWLSAGAKKAWKRLSEELLRYNLLSRVDREAFAMLCQTIGRLEMVERSIDAKARLLVAEGKDPADALMDTTPNGLRVQSALYQVLNKEQGKLHKLLESFGLRPDARAGVSTAIRAQLQLFEGGQSGQAGDKKGPPPAAEAQGFDEFV